MSDKTPERPTLKIPDDMRRASYGRTATPENNLSKAPKIKKKPSSFLKMLKKASHCLVIIYSVGFCIAIPYNNWRYAQENGFIKWMLFGEVMPTLKSSAWPEDVWKWLNTPDIEKLRKAAEQGDAEAQRNLGQAYLSGLGGLTQNYVEAVKWHRKAAEQGDAVSQLFLCGAYQNGIGVQKNDTESIKWLRKSAEQGYADAEFVLGMMYHNGFSGLPNDDVEAVKWLHKAAEQGNNEAQHNIEIIQQKTNQKM